MELRRFLIVQNDGPSENEERNCNGQQDHINSDRPEDRAEGCLEWLR